MLRSFWLRLLCYADGSFAESEYRKELVAEVVLVGELYHQRCRRSGC